MSSHDLRRYVSLVARRSVLRQAKVRQLRVEILQNELGKLRNYLSGQRFSRSDVCMMHIYVVEEDVGCLHVSINDFALVVQKG